MKIEKLTKEQEEYLPVFREEWRGIGLSTAPIDGMIVTGKQGRRDY